MAKRLFDMVCALLGLMVLAPFLAAVALIIKLGSRGPVFYRGVRVGKDGRAFRIFKFRTMVVDAEKLGATSTPEDDPRITPAGAWLRRYKLDEFPQLLNVVTGDMSLVGPRPEVPSGVELYTQAERDLLSVRPGVTDYASIRFSNEGEILRGSSNPDRDYQLLIAPEKKRLGLEYVRRHSLGIDLKILLATLWKLAGGNPESILGAGTLAPRVPGSTTASEREPS